MAQLQRKDTQVSLDQGETIRRLTLLNMVFLPPSFIAAVFGMNTSQTRENQMWHFVVTALCFLGVTILLSLWGIVVRKRSSDEGEGLGMRSRLPSRLLHWGGGLDGAERKESRPLRFLPLYRKRHLEAERNSDGDRCTE